MANILQWPYLIASVLLGVAASTVTISNIAEASHEHRFDTDSRLSGASLENSLWEAIRSHHLDELAELVSPIFLGGNASVGFTGHTSEISNLLNLHITNFTINNISETQGEDIRIVAYHLTADGSNPLNDRRVSVWQRTKHKHHQFFWQLISHTVL